MNASSLCKICSSLSYWYVDWRHDKQYVEFLKEYVIKLNNTVIFKNFSNIMTFLRKLIIVTSFVFLDWFDKTFIKLNKTSLIENMIVLKNKDFNAHHFIDMIKRIDDFVTNIDLKKIKFISFKSSSLRYIFHQINIYVLFSTIFHKRRKLFLCKNVSLSAQFWKMFINLIYVETTVLHADLNDQKRVNLMKRFNDQNDELIILIIMYAVFAQKMNLNKCCNKILIVINVINISQKWQDWKKVLRIFFLIFINYWC
jgi:hypothetical protein